MPVRANIRGFVPVRHINGRLNPSPHMRTTIDQNTSGNNLGSIFAGDIVFLNPNGALTSYADEVTATSVLPLGVVAQVLDNNKRPFTFSQPGAGPHIPASTAGYAMVYEDPGLIYTATCSTTANIADVGKFCNVRVCAANTAVGRSGYSVDINVAATASAQFMKMVGVSPLDSTLVDLPISGAANQDIEVIFVNQQWSNPYQSFSLESAPSATRGE